jgi:hypothetical protein
MRKKWMMKWPDFKKRFQKTKPETPKIDVVCKNCETKFKGHFCPECGQSVRDYDKPFSFIFYNFAGDFFAFDTRFFQTFKTLLLKPGFLTKEYFDGKRVKYAPPFRIFIFASFILFFLLQVSANRGLDVAFDSSLNSDKILGSDSTLVAETDSTINITKQSINESGTNNLILKDEKEIFIGSGSLRQTLSKLATFTESKLDEISDDEERDALLKFIRLCRTPEQAIAKVLQYLSWAFFLLLPIFALLLKLVYIRKKHNYIKHLVFSVHVHSFIFIVLIFSTGLNIITSGTLFILTLVLFVLIPVYLIIALKRFYGQKFGKVILKFISVSIVYNFVFWVMLGIVFLNALSII